MTEAEWLVCTDPARMLAWRIDLGRQSQFGVPTYTAPSDRKLRLFACAACRQAHELTGGCQNPDSIRLADLSDDYADGLIPYSTLEAFRPSHPDCTWPLRYDRNVHITILNTINDKVFLSGQAALLREIVGNPWRKQVFRIVSPDKWRCAGCGAVRHPVLTVDESFGPCECGRWEWRQWDERDEWLAHADGRVPKLAQVIYDERRWGEMGMLADALEEAGCEDEGILRWCRGQEVCPDCMGEGELRAGSSAGIVYSQCRRCVGPDGYGTGWIPRRGPSVRGDWCLDLLTGRE